MGTSVRAGSATMSDYWRQWVIDQVERGDSLEQIDHELELVRSVSDDERAALWLLAWGEQQRGKDIAHTLSTNENPVPRAHRWTPARSPAIDPMTAALELAHAETGMDVAVLGEIRDGHEVVRFAAGDLQSFGLAPGASMPVEDTYCYRLLTGRLSNYVPDTHADEQLRDLEITRVARVGAYLGVPLTAFDARLYVLCCLAHEQRPQLGERDVLFLRGTGESILAQLQEHRARQTDDSDLTPAR
ncbi:MAG: GAF domain-containing protein [Solirubrobacteraceae bacterium]